LSALGLLATDIQHDLMRTFVQRGPQYDLAGMEAVYQALHTEAAAHLAAEGIPPERRLFQRLADLRYARQGFEVTVDWPGEAVSAAAVAQVLQTFHRRHEQLYTYAAPDTPVEIVNLRLRAVGQMEKLTLPHITTAPVAGTTPDPMQARPVYFSGEGFRATPVYTRATLQATHAIPGPAIVEQLDATTVIFPGQEAVVDLYGNLLIHLLRS
jgi:N-methylhydantoinase A